jgi:co-chaperonin GroES (HSP10)|tara:strand:- start:132 stop:392 length:261 start_codon:yes stop_codon:yes gene_type:complete
MKAIGRNLIIEKIKEGTTKTEGGLLLAENQREDIRYIEAKIISVGADIVGVKENDNIFYDRHAGHKIEIEKKSYHVIKAQDIVVVL